MSWRRSITNADFEWYRVPGGGCRARMSTVTRCNRSMTSSGRTFRGESGIPEIVWQRLPDDHRASKSKSPEGESGTPAAWYGQLVTPISDFRDGRCTVRLYSQKKTTTLFRSCAMRGRPRKSATGSFIWAKGVTQVQDALPREIRELEVDTVWNCKRNRAASSLENTTSHRESSVCVTRYPTMLWQLLLSTVSKTFGWSHGTNGVKKVSYRTDGREMGGRPSPDSWQWRGVLISGYNRSFVIVEFIGGRTGRSAKQRAQVSHWKPAKPDLKFQGRINHCAGCTMGGPPAARGPRSTYLAVLTFED